MGITANYARVGATELERIKADPKQYWSLRGMPWDLSEASGPGEAERLYIDKDWEVLSWLCSPLGRAEEHHMAAVGKIDLKIKDRGEFKAALKREVEALGLTYVDADSLPDDPILSAIQGRRGHDRKSDIDGLGLNASVLTPEEVRQLSSTLDELNVDDLRARFDVREMEALGLPGDWEETELDEFYLPQLNRIRTLYARAAEAGQHVVVVML